MNPNPQTEMATDQSIKSKASRWKEQDIESNNHLNNNI